MPQILGHRFSHKAPSSRSSIMSISPVDAEAFRRFRELPLRWADRVSVVELLHFDDIFRVSFD